VDWGRQIVWPPGTDHDDRMQESAAECIAGSLQRVQGLLPACSFSRARKLLTVFCSTKCRACVCFVRASTDEASCGRDVVISIPKKHQWAEKNPHGVIHSRHVGDSLVGPHVFQKALSRFPKTGSHSTNVVLRDGAPAHVSRAVRDVLSTDGYAEEDLEI
jgi:hypothetical protein